MKNVINKKSSPKILIVDDVVINLDILEDIMEEVGYEPLCASSVQEAIEIMNESLPQLILSDFSMPGMDGLEFCKLLKSNPRTRDIPFIFITVLDSSEEKEQAFLAGAVDFIQKPFDRIEVIMRVKNHLEIYQMKQEMESYNWRMHQLVSEQQKRIDEEQEHMLYALAKIVEKRDLNTGRHLENVGYNSYLMAQSMQLLPEFENQITDEFVDTIGAASKIHDIGNILISDQLLMRDGPVEEWERDIMHQHTDGGAKLLEEICDNKKTSRFIDMAIRIVRSHHEKWDGTGYPDQKKGNQIPLEARIVALVDTFDTLLSKRSYREAYSIEESIKIINEESGKTFEPAIVNVFNKVWKRMKTNNNM